ncbi:hypothetical protein CDAR_616051 [Caerostris darwini]|uniref:Uncharacterized protein n=1 Tax=Caerostris darwini TaxID=1538125 RepID=A0AAV4RU76_9ARAC|nr:hypothetical protein CDAR_616051 [Caerostris darwini]
MNNSNPFQKRFPSERSAPEIDLFAVGISSRESDLKCTRIPRKKPSFGIQQKDGRSLVDFSTFVSTVGYSLTNGIVLKGVSFHVPRDSNQERSLEEHQVSQFCSRSTPLFKLQVEEEEKSFFRSRRKSMFSSEEAGIDAGPPGNGNNCSPQTRTRR